MDWIVIFTAASVAADLLIVAAFWAVVGEARRRRGRARAGQPSGAQRRAGLTIVYGPDEFLSRPDRHRPEGPVRTWRADVA